jgi:hypothetical protein
MIRDLRKHSAKDLICYFHLWGFGGPNWRLEELRWYQEQDREWTDIGPKKLNHPTHRSTYQSHDRRNFLHTSSKFVWRSRPLTGANTVPLGSTRQGTDRNRSTSAECNSLIGRSGNLNPNQNFTKSVRGTPADHSTTQIGPSAQQNDVSTSIFCSRCLMKGHWNQLCTNQIRCRSCYNYGHIAAKCLSRLRSKRFSWRIKYVSPIYEGENYPLPIA